MRTGSVRRGEVGARGPGRVPGYAARSCESSPAALGCTTADTEPKRARPIQVTQERPQVCRSQGRELPRVRWGDWTSRGGDTDPRTVTRLKGLGLSIRPKGCRRRPQRERAGMGRGGREMVGPLLCGKVADQLEDKMRSSGSRGPRMGNVLCVPSASAKVCKSALGGHARCASSLTASAGTRLWSHTASSWGHREEDAGPCQALK